MNPNTLAHDDTGSLLTVDANPVRLRLPIGSAIFVFSGEVWITQEGLRDDVVLGRGERFDVKSRELILASGLRGNARIYAASPIDISASVDSDLFALLRLRARRLRAEYVDRVAHVWLKTVLNRREVHQASSHFFSSRIAESRSSVRPATSAAANPVLPSACFAASIRSA